jgi:cytoskeleton protein RodZ
MQSEPDGEAGESAVAMESSAQPDAEMVEPEAEQVQVAEPQTAEPEAEPGDLARPERSAPTGSDKMQIIVHADTWADVKDASDHQLVYDLLRADSSLELMGEAPFVVFLGNGHGVEILYNGEEIDIAPRIRNDNTARLNIGG